MNETNNRDSIMRMARGAFEERVDYEMDKVIQNILDPNTKATAKRKITLTIELTPDDERRQIQVSVTAKSTLAATNPVKTFPSRGGTTGSSPPAPSAGPSAGRPRSLVRRSQRSRSSVRLVPPARSEAGGLEDERETDLPLVPLHAGDGLRESDREQQPPEGPTRGLYVRTPRRLRDVQQSMPAQLPAGRLHRLHPAGRKKAGDQDVAEVVPHAPGKPEGGKRP